MEAAHHRADGHPHLVGGVAVAELAEVHELDGAAEALRKVGEAAAEKPAKRVEPRGVYQFGVRIGRGVFDLGREFFETMVFTGHLLVVVGRVLVNPRRIRWAACVSLALTGSAAGGVAPAARAATSTASPSMTGGVRPEAPVFVRSSEFPSRCMS